MGPVSSVDYRGVGRVALTVDRYRLPPPPPPGRPPLTGEDGTLVFIIEPETPLARPAPPPPPGASTRTRPPLAMGRNEPLPEAITRIGLGLLDRAAAALGQPDRDRAAAEALLAIGQSRSMLRLVSGAIGERIFGFEDARLREAKDLIEPANDNATLLPALDSLTDLFGERLAPDAFVSVKAGLAARYRPTGDREVASALEIIAAARARYAAFPTDAIGYRFAAIEPGLRATYSKGQLRMGEAYRHSTDRAFERWLTQVAYLRDQAAMLDPDWATLGLSERLRKVAVALGEARTLALLRSIVGAEALGEDQDERELIRLLALGRCRDIYSQMLEVGGRLFADDPADFAERFGTYWSSWRAH